MKTKEIRERLYSLKDDKYLELEKGLIPDSEDLFIGVRTPDLKTLAKEIGYDKEFLGCLPHGCFEENQLHAFIISGIKDYDTAMKETEKFLPYINNWATCDQLVVKCFIRHKDDLLKKIKKWIRSRHEYTVRYAIGCLMRYYLGEDFKDEYAQMTVKVKLDTYYVNMMKAWYFATALAKNYDEVIPYIEERRLDEWTHKKAIQKARESFRVSPEHKEYLVSLR